MNVRSALLSIILACAATSALAQDRGTICRNEVANRGYGGYNVENTRVIDNVVRGTMRSGSEVLEFQCDVDNMGNLTEVRVGRIGTANPNLPQAQGRYEDSREYQRGYSDGYRRSPYNNYRNDVDYQRGYDSGYEDRRRR